MHFHAVEHRRATCVITENCRAKKRPDSFCRWMKSADYRVGAGRVHSSHEASVSMASARVRPHMPRDGGNEAQNAGRSGRPNRTHRSSSARCTHRSPAFFPLGMPWNGVVMDGAMQQAPHPGLHSMWVSMSRFTSISSSLISTQVYHADSTESSAENSSQRTFTTCHDHRPDVETSLILMRCCASVNLRSSHFRTRP